MSVGLDYGTSMLVVARKDDKDKTITRTERNCFIDLEKDFSEIINQSDYNFIKEIENNEEKFFVIGNDAIKLDNLLASRNSQGIKVSGLRRPMAKMVINSKMDKKAIKMLKYISQAIIGKPKYDGEICVLSVPADPIDESFDAVFHKDMCISFIEELGYQAFPLNEALAVVYATNPKLETKDEGTLNMTGIGCSFGAGGINGCVAYKGKDTMRFSFPKCLSKDFLVKTLNGVKKIQDIKIGDQIITASGKYAKVNKIFNNGHRDKLLRIKLEKMPFNNIDLTSDHKILIKRNYNWEWVEASQLKIGDIVGEPVVKMARSTKTIYFGYDPETKKMVNPNQSKNTGKIVGIFLGDGWCCFNKKRGSGVIAVAFNANNQKLINNYIKLFNKIFKRKATNNIENNMHRIVISHTGCAKYFKEKFYDQNNEKSFPFRIDGIENQMAIGIIRGLLDSDGNKKYKKKKFDGYDFNTTSLNLAVLSHDLLNRFLINHNIMWRKPRIGGINNRGVQIIGKKSTYIIRMPKTASQMFNVLVNGLSTSSGSIQCPSFIEYKIKEIKEINYNNDVYDLNVDSEDHSFSSIGITVHNCGDWIDQEVAKVTNLTPSQVTMQKEKTSKEGTFNLTNPDYEDEVLAALYIYYRNLLTTVVKEFKKEFVKNNIIFDDPLEVVVSGGTSMPKGFCKLLEGIIKENNWPFEISNVRKATDPLASTAIGCLVLAQSKESKQKEK